MDPVVILLFLRPYATDAVAEHGFDFQVFIPPVAYPIPTLSFPLNIRMRNTTLSGLV